MKSILFLALFFSPSLMFAQNTFRAEIKDRVSREPLVGATAFIADLNRGASADAAGRLEIENIPDGSYAIRFSFVGYESREINYTFPLTRTGTFTVVLTSSTVELDVVIVESTRANRGIAEIPTRIEVLTEEVEEAGTMDPAKISHLLTHSTGVQVQVLSPSSGAANVRIQGLPGKYTQMLRDGFPLYGGFSGSLEILQIPPLDLKQVEFIKGSASTLYGGGAIAGLINLISRTPTEEPEFFIHFNKSHVGATDINAFYANRDDKLGVTLFASRNLQNAHDPADIGFSALPYSRKFNFHPKLYLYLSEQTTIMAGATFTDETRQGGDMRYLDERIPDQFPFYREWNHSSRTTTQFRLNHRLGELSGLEFKNSFSMMERGLKTSIGPFGGNITFSGNQLSNFWEASYNFRNQSHNLITGLNFYNDRFREDLINVIQPRDERWNTAGAFAQYTLMGTSWFNFEAGLRTDYSFELEEIFLLPRLSALFKISPVFTIRAGGGLGYKLPSIFNEEAEEIFYNRILPIDTRHAGAERSYGGNIDFGYKRSLGTTTWLSLNQMFFTTMVTNPLILTFDIIPHNEFVNSTRPLFTSGFETQAKMGFGNFVWFIGYTYTDARVQDGSGNNMIPLTPRHSLKGDLLYDLADKWRVGMDYEYKGKQKLSSGMESRDFWTFGFLAQRFFPKWSVYINFENITDVRQSRYEDMRPVNWGMPREVWAPLEGFYANAGFRINI